jgi:hypothetical protein
MENKNLFREAECGVCGWRWDWEEGKYCPECHTTSWGFRPESKPQCTARLARIADFEAAKLLPLPADTFSA